MGDGVNDREMVAEQFESGRPRFQPQIVDNMFGPVASSSQGFQVQAPPLYPLNFEELTPTGPSFIMTPLRSGFFIQPISIMPSNGYWENEPGSPIQGQPFALAGFNVPQQDFFQPPPQTGGELQNPDVLQSQDRAQFMIDRADDISRHEVAHQPISPPESGTTDNQVFLAVEDRSEPPEEKAVLPAPAKAPTYKDVATSSKGSTLRQVAASSKESTSKAEVASSTSSSKRSTCSDTLVKLCNFCRNRNATYSVYTSHVLKDENGTVQCPVLRKLECYLCGATGDHAHFRRYCPERNQHPRNPAHGRTRKNPNLSTNRNTVKH